MSFAPHHPARLIPLLALLVAVCALASKSRPAKAHGPSSSTPAPTSTLATEYRLPDLVMLPLRDFFLDYKGGRRIIRFSTLVENQGDGPFEVVGSRPNLGLRDLTVTQNLEAAQGGIRELSTKALMRYSDIHNHYHVQDFEEYRLRPEGSQAAWRYDHKEGFCLSDDGRAHGQVPKRYLDCSDNKPDLLRVTEGLGVGWIDDYDWYERGQWIYIDGLPIPGNFCVSAEVDPLREFTEKTRANNTATSLVRITSEEVTVIREGC